jgi:hypothetical protein
VPDNGLLNREKRAGTPPLQMAQVSGWRRNNPAGTQQQQRRSKKEDKE